MTQSDTLLHQTCYGDTEPPRRPHGGEELPIEKARVIFRELFGPGSRRLPRDLTPMARVLNEVMRRTLLPRIGNRETITRIQQWLVYFLSSQTTFDIWDVIVSEMEDTITEGFKTRRQLPFAHLICFILRRLMSPFPHEARGELSDTTTSFLVYNMSQLVGARPGNRATREPRQRPAVAETEEQQDEAVEALA